MNIVKETRYQLSKLKNRLTNQNKINFRGRGIVNFIDVGSVGDLPKPWNQNKPIIRNLLKFEPRDEENNNQNIIFVNSALWESNCQKNFYIYKGFSGSGSSLFEQNIEYVKENFETIKNKGPENLANTWLERSEIDRIEKFSCETLDNVLENLGNKIPYHFLKIDAQGAEYQILKGAENLLQQDHCIGLFLELFVIPLYKDIKLLPEVVEFLKTFDFELIKKFPPHGTFDSQHDCLFIKKGSQGTIREIIEEVYQIK